MEEFVKTIDEHAIREQLILGYKDRKTPSDSQVNELKGLMGSNHVGHDNAEVQRALGLQSGATSHHSKSAFIGSGPSKVQTQDAALAALEKERKDKQEVAKKKGKAVKPFESAAVWFVLGQELEGWAVAVRMKYFETKQKCEAVKPELEELPSDARQQFHVAETTLNNRFQAMQVVFSITADADLVPSDAARARHNDQRKTYFEYQKLTDMMSDSSGVEPFAKIESVWTMSECWYQVKNPTLVQASDVKDEQARLKVGIADMKTLVHRVSEQVSRVKYLMNKHHNGVSKALQIQKRKDDEAKTARDVRAVAKAKARAEKLAKTKTRLYKWLDCAQVSFLLMKIENMDEFVKSPHHNEPVLLKLDKLEVPSEHVVKLDEFTKACLKDKQIKGKSYGCGANLVTSDAQTLQALVKGLFPVATKVFCGLGSSEVTYLKTPWHFVYTNTMSACAPETAFVGSVRVNLKGTRRVCVCSTDKLVGWSQRQLPAVAKAMTMQELCDLFSEVDNDDIAASLKDDVDPKFAKVEPNTILVIPWGFVVCEQNLKNNKK